jgi:UDP-glucose:(heptosyl)LPS alpha-1,3-glucosyltransferase
MSTFAGPVTIVAHDIGAIGGMERQLTELVTGLADRGHDVTVIARCLELPEGAPVRFIRVRGPRRPFPIAYPWFLVAGSIATVRRRRGVVQATGAIVLNRVDVVAVHLCHQAIARLGIVPRAAGDGAMWRLNARIAELMSKAGERWALRPARTRRVVAVSCGVSAELTEHFPALDGAVRTIPNGVDVERFAPGRASAAAREAVRIVGVERVALFVGSEWAGKGLRHAIEALAEAPGWGLVVVGRGDEEGQRQHARRAGVEERVRFAGPRADVAEIYRAVDAFVLPSAYETFSLVAHEAAAAALPLIVTRVHGIGELIQDGYSGWLVDADPKAIGARLCRIAADPAAAKRMGERARAAVLERSWPAMVESHRVLYAELAGS